MGSVYYYILLLLLLWCPTSCVLFFIPTLNKRLGPVPIHMYSNFTLIIVYRPQMINGNRLHLILNSRQASLVQHSVRLNSDHALLGIVRVLARSTLQSAQCT